MKFPVSVYSFWLSAADFAALQVSASQSLPVLLLQFVCIIRTLVKLYIISFAGDYFASFTRIRSFFKVEKGEWLLFFFKGASQFTLIYLSLSNLISLFSYFHFNSLAFSLLRLQKFSVSVIQSNVIVKVSFWREAVYDEIMPVRLFFVHQMRVYLSIFLCFYFPEWREENLFFFRSLSYMFFFFMCISLTNPSCLFSNGRTCKTK